MPALRHAVSFVLLAAWLVLLGASTRAHAQPSVAAAEVLFRAGREALSRGDAGAACAKFRESYRLEAALGTLLNIAVCEEALGELSNAWQHYQEVVHALSEHDDRVTIAQQHLHALEPRLPRVTIKLGAGAPAQTRVTIGSVDLGNAGFGIPLPVDPGRYDVGVSADGYAERSYPLDLHEGDRVTLEVAPGPLASVSGAAPADPSAAQPAALGAQATLQPSAANQPSSVPSAAPSSSTASHRTLAYVLVGTGAASLVASGVMAAFMFDRLATAHAECVGTQCNSVGYAAADSGQMFFVGTLVALGAGVVSSGLGTYLLLREPGASEARVALAPVILPNAGYLLARGRF